MSLSEIKHLLTDARETLEFIKKSYEQSLNDTEISIALKLKIKHFLEDVKSSLDYIGYYIFTHFCASEIKAKFEDHVKSLYFPNKRTEKEFDTYVKNMYPGLEKRFPEIVHIFKSVQPFTYTEWFTNLNELVNKNKHRNLSTQSRKDTSVHIHSMKVTNEITLTDSSFSGSLGGNIVINGVHFNSLNYNNSLVEKADATFHIEIIFKDLNKPVIPTLSVIYDGVCSVFNELEPFLKEKYDVS